MRSLILVVSIFFSNLVYSQTIDTVNLILNSKVLLIPRLKTFATERYYNEFISYKPETIFLKSRGFNGNYIFYKMKIQDAIAYRIAIDSNRSKEYHFFQFDRDEVVFAFNMKSKEIYRLVGFECNDVKKFFHDISVYYEVVENIKIKCKTINNDFWVEGLDLKCLCNVANGRNSKCVEPLKMYFE